MERILKFGRAEVAKVRPRRLDAIALQPHQPTWVVRRLKRFPGALRLDPSAQSYCTRLLPRVVHNVDLGIYECSREGYGFAWILA